VIVHDDPNWELRRDEPCGPGELPVERHYVEAGVTRLPPAPARTDEGRVPPRPEERESTRGVRSP
jgi:hypothetical protein